MQSTKSNHGCLLVDIHQSGTDQGGWTKSFQYKNMWHRDELYLNLVRSAWGEDVDSANLQQLRSRMGRVQEALHEWDQNVFGSVWKGLVKLRKQLEVKRSRSLGTGPSRQERRLMS